MALDFLERECLQLEFQPVQSSHTTSNDGNESGGQTKSTTGVGEDSISDDGDASRDKRDKAKG